MEIDKENPMMLIKPRNLKPSPNGGPSIYLDVEGDLIWTVLQNKPMKETVEFVCGEFAAYVEKLLGVVKEEKIFPDYFRFEMYLKNPQVKQEKENV